MKIFPETGPGSRAGRELEINRFLIQIFTETGPGLAEPAESSKSTEFEWNPDTNRLGLLICSYIIIYFIFAYIFSYISYISLYEATEKWSNKKVHERVSSKFRQVTLLRFSAFNREFARQSRRQIHSGPRPSGREFKFVMPGLLDLSVPSYVLKYFLYSAI